MSGTQEEALAELRRANATLRAERDAAFALADALAMELSVRKTTFAEHIDHQAATIDVLKAMSASPGDPQPVFDLIADQAQVLCGGAHVGLFEYDGTLIHCRTAVFHVSSPDVVDAYRSTFPRPADQEPNLALAISIRERRIVHIRDADMEEGLSAAVRRAGVRSGITVPLLRDGKVIGIMSLASYEIGGFSDTQVELLKTFAEQAVIAITSAETFRALEARTAELAARNTQFAEQIDHQSATIDVLKAMSASPGDPIPVFDIIAERARTLCNGITCTVWRYDGKMQHMWTQSLAFARDEGQIAFAASYPRPPSSETAGGRAILTREMIEVPDIQFGQGVDAAMRGIRPRASVGVPMLHQGTVLGALTLGKTEPGNFSGAQKALLKTFAEQAVIAIRSAETFRALEARTTELAVQVAHQEATIDVLKVMSSSTSDTQPVFDIILSRAIALSGAKTGGIFGLEAGLLHPWAMLGFDPEAEAEFRKIFPVVPSERGVMSRAILRRQTLYARDYHAENPKAPQHTRDLGYNSLVAVPLLREGAAIGVLTVQHTAAEAFSAEHIALLETFAEQAVIAIGSVATFRQLQDRTAELAARNSDFAERIDQQAATIDVLKVMSASPDDTQPIFDQIVRRARELCNSETAGLFEYDGELVHFRAINSSTVRSVDEWAASSPEGAAHAALWPMKPTRGSISCRAILDREIIHTRDVPALAGVDPKVRNTGAGSQLSIPLLRDGAAIGVITLRLRDTGGFTDSQIALLQTFAEQAVIAIGSVATYRALRERTAELAARNSDFAERIDQQAATIDVLKVMSASPDHTQPVFDQIVRRAQELCGSTVAALFEYDGELVHYRAYSNGTFQSVAEHAASGPVGAAYAALWPMAPSRKAISCWAILDRQVIHIRDRDAVAGLDPAIRTQNNRSLLVIPLLRDDTVLGSILLASAEVGGFTDSQVELLKTFAEQAVIAIGSVATYRALRERTSELQRSVEYQAATIDVLKVMSSSTNDTQPVFDVILRHAMALSDAVMGGLFEFDGELAHFRAGRGYDPAQLEIAQRPYPRPPSRDTVSERVILDGQLVYLRDYQAEPGIGEHAKGLGIGSLLVVPLSRDGVTIGALSWVSPKIDGFTTANIDLLQTFAEQAVIAIGTTATFRALQERTAELTRSVAELQALEEVLRAVNSSLDLETVLATVINHAVPLAGAEEGLIYEFSEAEQVFVPKAAYGMSEDRVAALRERRIRIGETYLGRSAAEREPVTVDDVQADSSTPEARTLLQGIHAVLAVPLLREYTVVGGLVIRRRSEGAFAPATIALMQTFAAQSVLAIENARLFEAARRAQAASDAALADLRRTQDRLVQTEKLASLGQLTAGIAHEIKNPLNFVNNFAALSVELLDELGEALEPAPLEPATREEVGELTTMLKGNLEKVVAHGKRADGIVKNMLLHSRASGGERREVDFNATVEEALNLAYHGARAEKPGFNITLARNYDPAVGMAALYPQDFTRVLLNLIGNGFYAATKRKAEAPEGFEPTLTVSTEARPDGVVVRVRDNGTGMAEAVRARLFEPFFTTKPAGEGTGLGLSISHDIVVKQHGGTIAVASEPGAFTEFTVTLPRGAA